VTFTIAPIVRLAGKIGYARPALLFLAEPVSALDFVNTPAVSRPLCRAFFLVRLSAAFSSLSLCHF